MTADEIKTILDLHAKWLLGEGEGKRAYLSRAYLFGVNLSEANLSEADLSEANLSRANLSRANLSRANLSRAYLFGAYLSEANLSRVNLSRANLSRANLSGANLSRAYLFGAYLFGANLSRATMPDGNSWETYTSEVVPALLQAGGRPLVEVCTREHLECHDWENCPMHAAFGASGLDEVPPLYRSAADLFIGLYDGKALTPEVIAAACGVTL